MMVYFPSVAFFYEFWISWGTSDSFICLMDVVESSFFSNSGSLFWIFSTSSLLKVGIHSKISQLPTKIPPVKTIGLEIVKFYELNLP